MPSSGSPTLDHLLEGGLALGDNIVWLAEHDDDNAAVAEAFLAAGSGPRLHVCLRDPARCHHGAGPVDHLAHADGRLDADVVESVLLDPAVDATTRLVVDGFDELVLRWGAPDAVAFYRRTCPRLFDRGAIAYWLARRDIVGSSVIDGVARIAQCVFELRAGRVRVIKAEGRPRRLQGATAAFAVEGGRPVVSREHAVGRLGEGLRRLRKDRNLTQAQLASIAGVTPAAISQAETGRRGLSLDTIVPLCDALRIGVDDLLGTGRLPDPFLARHDRALLGAGVVPLFDDVALGARTFLIQLAVGESAPPPFAHKGPELLLVAEGLVLVDLDETTPVLRAGDGLRAAGSVVQRLTNLAEARSRVFWIAS